ncbi:amidase [Hydrogenophaga sp.]|uniref:amidase n=1 Tax=Hydrogenophaga sp. TaxID=1904254 RepID=UPI0027314FFD|nr:amidase [Hydrogenophaga sp.]MDP2019149.1 amidase [Hydrogenophaga sp.]MDP3168384.1 amidase [Hydrogenophaga sp.]MDP3810995.1 amidase [Hydrogenophaga sp.]
MQKMEDLSAREIAARVARRELGAETVARAFVERVQALEPATLAWQHFDAAQVIAQAQALDRAGAQGALAGVPIAVKDLIDTADMPTTYGSPIYAGHRPAVDAAVVASVREAGGVVMGKTVTTEFATFKPGVTRNPRASADAPRTPGGSSSGSAAAVACGMVPLAFGTQTAASVIRPAAYCGVVGYKPTFGLLPMAGIKSLSPTLDTAGVFARSVDDAAFFVSTLSRIELAMSPVKGWRVGVCHTPHWDLASDDARRALQDAARHLDKLGARLVEAVVPGAWVGLAQAQMDIMGFEAWAAFAPERNSQAKLFSPAFAEVLASGAAVSGERLAAAHALAIHARGEIESLLQQVDVLIAPSATGEAPLGLDATGNPIFSRLWSLLGVPCVHVPTGVGSHGMPVGVTVIGPRWRDAKALSAALLLEAAVRG